jgi:lysozyme
MQLSNEARLRMRAHEKPMMKYYNDGGGNSGHCTWGIGILVHRGPCTAEELARSVTEAQVNAEFTSRVNEAERTVTRRVKVDLTQDQFDALVSYTFNRGSGGTTDVFNSLNAGNFDGAAEIISSTVFSSGMKNGKKVMIKRGGLVARRAEESAPFRTKK